MAVPIRMQRLSKGMAAGRVLNWLRSAGERVQRGQGVVEVETDKSVVEIEAPADGEILAVVVGADEQVAVGTVLAWLGEPGEPVPAVEPAGPQDGGGAPVAVEDRDPRGADAEGAGPAGAGRARAAPAVRRLAAEHGVDLGQLHGSGPGGRITRADVEAAIAAPAMAPSAGPARPPIAAPAEAAPDADPDVQRQPLSGIRRIMARRMADSARTYAAATTVVDVDMSAVQARRKSASITYTSAVVHAAGAALGEHPLLNASLDGDTVLLHRRVHVGVAVDGPRGLTVVCLADADRRPLAELDAALRELAGQAKAGHLKARIMAAPTFTITNSGVFGSLLFTPIINPPHSAVLGMGKVQDTPVVRDGQIVVRPVMYLALTYDHRLIEGAEAVRFLQAVKARLQAPQQPPDQTDQADQSDPSDQSDQFVPPPPRELPETR